MLYNISLNVARRVVLLPLASRSILARQFSSAHTVALPAKSAAATPSTKSTTKSATKPKTESTTKTATKKKVTTKPKPKDTKPKKAAVKKPATYTSDQLKVPTRPIMSGYIMFATEERTKLGPPANLQASQDVTRECAQKWKALGEDEKEVYRVKALEFKEKAGKAYDEWVNNLDPKVLRAINMKRRAAGKLRVRRRPSPDDVRGPLPPFLKFYTEFKAENPSLPVRVTSSQAAVAWHALSPEARKQYSDSYQADKKAFLLEKSTSHTSQQSV